MAAGMIALPKANTQMLTVVNNNISTVVDLRAYQ
jgi:hypothetical protein